MKTPLHTRLICCWLAVLVLLSSTGFGMVEKWCQMRGHTKSSLLMQSGCVNPCETEQENVPLTNGPVIKKMPCCKTTVSYQHLDVSRFIADQHAQPAPQPADFIPNPQFRLLLAALLPAAASVLVPVIADDPDPETGRFRLISFCTWLI